MQSSDLNLLPVVRTLLEEQSVTRAAARLNLSAPATSRALERARHLFGDPLLVRSGRGVVMTPRARELLGELVSVLDGVARVLDRPDVLLPERIQRSFVIRANEAVISAAAAELVALVSREAPRAEIRFELETADDVTDLRQGHVDLAIGSYGDATTDIEHEPLLEERLLAIVRKGHPLTTKTKRPGVKQFAALDHIVVSRMGRRRNALDIALYERGLDRKVVAVVPSFAVAIVMVARSDATTVAPSRMTSMFVECGLLSTYQSPIPPPPVTISQLWHASNTADPTHQWLRSCLHRVARTV